MPYADPEKGRQRRREYQRSAEGKAVHHKANESYRKRNRLKHKAHNAVAKAILRGKMLPMPCLVCGKDAEAHHPDYSAPLAVIWLCPEHHREVHAMVKTA